MSLSPVVLWVLWVSVLALRCVARRCGRFVVAAGNLARLRFEAQRGRGGPWAGISAEEVEAHAMQAASFRPLSSNKGVTDSDIITSHRSRFWLGSLECLGGFGARGPEDR